MNLWELNPTGAPQVIPVPVDTGTNPATSSGKAEAAETVSTDSATTGRPSPNTLIKKLTGVTPLIVHKAADIVAGKSKPPVHIVQNVLRPGYAVIGGGKSAGKTVLGVDIAEAVATGKPALGYFKVQTGQALYIALEQSLTEWEELAVLKGLKGLDNIDVVTAEDGLLRGLHEGGLYQIEEWIKSKSNPRAVFIDVLERWWTTNRGYSVNYTVLPRLHELGLKHDVAIVALHHTKKKHEREAVKEVLGDTGVVGTSSSVVVLEPPDKEGRIKMSVTGRLPANTYELTFDKLTLRFTCIGTFSDEARTPERGAILIMLKAVAPDPMTAQQILTEFHKLGRKDKTLEAAKVMLGEMIKDGEVHRVGRGLYTI